MLPSFYKHLYHKHHMVIFLYSVHTNTNLRNLYDYKKYWTLPATALHIQHKLCWSISLLTHCILNGVLPTAWAKQINNVLFTFSGNYHYVIPEFLRSSCNPSRNGTHTSQTILFLDLSIAVKNNKYNQQIRITTNNWRKKTITILTTNKCYWQTFVYNCKSNKTQQKRLKCINYQCMLPGDHFCHHCCLPHQLSELLHAKMTHSQHKFTVQL